MDIQLKKILMIATGGTIASKKSEDGLTPSLTSDELLSYVPEIREYCIPSSLQTMNIDSTNICADDWLVLEDVIEKNYEKYDGFVICHGYDGVYGGYAFLSHSEQPQTHRNNGFAKAYRYGHNGRENKSFGQFFILLLEVRQRRADSFRRQSDKGNESEKDEKQKLQRFFEHKFPLHGYNSGRTRYAIRQNAETGQAEVLSRTR